MTVLGGAVISCDRGVHVHIVCERRGTSCSATASAHRLFSLNSRLESNEEEEESRWGCNHVLLKASLFASRPCWALQSDIGVNKGPLGP